LHRLFPISTLFDYTSIFHPEERLELIDGEIIDRTPQGSGHATAVSLVGEALRTIFGAGYTVRIQSPLAVSIESEPEPDVAVVPGNPRDYKDGSSGSRVGN
jgi:Uma2 family endonuclease